MRIIVCVKQVPDPEGPQDCFVVRSESLRVEPRGIPPVLSLFDENALEAALRIQDAHPDETRVTVLSMGRRVSPAVLQKALAVGADDLVTVEGELFESATLDSFATAWALAAAVRKIGAFDLVLTGRQAADWNAGQVGIGIGHLLGIPAVTLARDVRVEHGTVRVERVIPGGYEVVRTRMPAVVVASNEVGVMRYPTMLQRRDAKKKPSVSWGSADIGFDAPPAARVRLERLFPPEMRPADCQIVEGRSPAEAGRRLAERLRRDGVL